MMIDLRSDIVSVFKIELQIPPLHYCVKANTYDFYTTVRLKQRSCTSRLKLREGDKLDDIISELLKVAIAYFW